MYKLTLLPTARILSPPEAAWVGALIEGEGALTSIGPNAYGVRYPTIQVANTDIEIIATLLRLTGVGRVCMDGMRGRRRPAHHKQQWRWAVQRHVDVQHLIEQIAPYCWKVRRGAGLRWVPEEEE